MLPILSGKKDESTIPNQQMSQTEKPDDSVFSMVTSVLKRSFEQTKADEPSEKETAKRAKYNDWSSDANPLWHYVKSKSDACNPHAEVNVKVLVNKDHDGQEQHLSLPITQAALRKIAPSFYEKVFFTDSSWKENVNGEVNWVGDETSPYYHPEAAAQVILFAHMKGGTINRSAYRSLEQLRQDFPDEFPWILNDIFRLCEQYQISKLQKQCQHFLEAQMNQSDDNVVYYLEWALAASPQINGLKIWEQAVTKKWDRDISFFKSLQSVIEADYRDCSEEKKTWLTKTLQKIFENKILSAQPFDRYALKDIGICFFSLYRDWNIPERMLRKIAHSFKGYMEISDGKPLHLDLLGAEGILAFSLCSASFYDLRNSTSMKSLILKYVSFIPKEEQSKFEEILALIKATMSFPNESLASFWTLYKQYPTNLLLLRKGIEFSLEAGEIDKAIFLSTQLLTQLPDDVPSLERRADCYIRKDELDLAMEDIRKINPQTVNGAVLFGHLCQCHLYFQKGENELAVSEFENYLKKGLSLNSQRISWMGRDRSWFRTKDPLCYIALDKVLSYLDSKGDTDEKILYPLWLTFYSSMAKLAKQQIIREITPNVLQQLLMASNETII
jgi:hypothetical protein